MGDSDSMKNKNITAAKYEASYGLDWEINKFCSTMEAEDIDGVCYGY